MCEWERGLGGFFGLERILDLVGYNKSVPIRFIRLIRVPSYEIHAKKEKPGVLRPPGFLVVSPGIEPGTHGFSVHCSTS